MSQFWGSSNVNFLEEKKRILLHRSLSSLSVHGYVGEDLQGLSSISAAKLSLEAEEETHILVKSHRPDVNSSINHTLVQTH